MPPKARLPTVLSLACARHPVSSAMATYCLPEPWKPGGSRLTVNRHGSPEASDEGW